MAAEDAGEEFTGMLKSVGQDLFNLIKTIVQENQRREREKKAQMDAAAKEKRAEEMAEKHRQEDREFMKSENEKMRSEMRDILKANGMETSDKNLALTQEVADKMKANEDQIDSNLSQIDANNSEISANQGKIDANNKTIAKLDDQIKGLGTDPQHQDTVNQLKSIQAGLGDMNKELTQKNSDLAQKNSDLAKKNTELEAGNIMLKNGQGLEGLQTDLSVRNNLAKQMDQVNTGIARDSKKLSDVNEKLAKNDEAQKKVLSPTDGSLPNMKEWEKLQTEKQDLLKQKEDLQKSLSQKEGQLKGLKDGVSLEQLQKASKIEGNIQQDKQKLEGLNKAIDGYEKNVSDLRQKNIEALKTGVGKADPDGVIHMEKQLKGLKTEKEDLQKQIAEQEKQVKDLRQVPNLDAPKVEGPKTEGPKLDGAKMEEGRPRAKSVGEKPDNDKPLSVREELARRGETTGYELQKKGLKQGQVQKTGVGVHH